MKKVAKVKPLLLISSPRFDIVFDDSFAVKLSLISCRSCCDQLNLEGYLGVEYCSADYFSAIFNCNNLGSLVQDRSCILRWLSASGTKGNVKITFCNIVQNIWEGNLELCLMKKRILSSEKRDPMQYIRIQDVQDILQLCRESESDKEKSCTIRIRMVEKLLACFLIKVPPNRSCNAVTSVTRGAILSRLKSQCALYLIVWNVFTKHFGTCTLYMH